MAKKKVKKINEEKKVINKDKEAKMVDEKEKQEVEKETQVEEQEEREEQAPEEVDREKQLEDDIAYWKDKYVRNMAEFENYRKRTMKEKADWIKSSNEGILISICDIMDNFERAMGQMKDDHHDDPFIKGIIQIKQQMDNLLVKEHVEKIETEGAEFDPAIHEALAHIPSDLEENKIVAVIQNGYKLYDKVMRTARVAVSNGQAVQSQPEENNNKE
ncbi:nucleotide exchange factor GrpE [bacterium]|nr:nucleotide exchange factor GrpE [bacterium]